MLKRALKPPSPHSGAGTSFRLEAANAQTGIETPLESIMSKIALAGLEAANAQTGIETAIGLALRGGLHGER